MFCSMSMKVPAIVKEAKEALESGLCVVIGLQTTGEVCEKEPSNINIKDTTTVLVPLEDNKVPTHGNL